MNLNNIAIIIGMPRAGTTWLYENLRTHPDICTSSYKEINRYLKDMTDDEYINVFHNCKKSIALDVSPLYFFDASAIRNIAKNHSKVIFIIRDEKSWLASMDAQIEKYQGNIKEMKKNQIYKFPVNNKKNINFNLLEYNHDQYISQIISIFTKKPLILKFQDITKNPLSTLKKIEAYLSIVDYFNDSNYIKEKINSKDKKISKLYSFLLKTKAFEVLAKGAIALLPEKFIHVLKKYFVYGK